MSFARRALVAAAFMSVAVPSSASAYIEEDNRVVTSFDGTPIVSKLFLPDGTSAAAPVPVILVTHGWGGSRQTAASGNVKRFLDEGYGVLTWDQRGFGQSGGQVENIEPSVEGKDVSALIDSLAADGRILREPGTGNANDIAVGMSGGSYAGGIQFATAVVDPRVDAIAPEIAWNNLLESLIPEGVSKIIWGLGLYGLGTATATGSGLSPQNPAGTQTGTVNPFLHRAVAEAAVTGDFSAETRQYFASKGPDYFLGGVGTPTLIIQGTVDTLFPPSQAIDNYEGMRAANPGNPVRMMWYGTGHGVSAPFSTGPAGYTQDRIVAWFDAHVKDEEGIDVGPGFEYLDDGGAWHGAAGYPVAPAATLSGSGAGTVAVNSEATYGGALGPQATTGRTTLKVPVTGEEAGQVLVGKPRVKLTYTGIGAAEDNVLKAPLFFQIVNTTKGHVVGNQITPKLLETDGERRTAEFDIEAISYGVDAGDELALEIVGTSANYEAYRGAAVFGLESVEVALPVAP